ncbi:hypothetical protein Bca4012_041493 [Brassica carinata]
MDPSVLSGRSPGVSQQAPLSVLRGGSATSPIYISSGESYSSSSGESDSSADVSQPNPLVGGSQQNRYRPLSYVKSQLSPKAPKMVVVLGADEAILYEGNSKRTVMLSNKTCTISFPAVGHVNVRPGGEIWYQLWWRGIIPFAAAGGCAIEVPVGGLVGFGSSFKEFADLRWSGDDSFVWCGYEFDD